MRCDKFRLMNRSPISDCDQSEIRIQIEFQVNMRSKSLALELGVAGHNVASVKLIASGSTGGKPAPGRGRVGDDVWSMRLPMLERSHRSILTQTFARKVKKFNEISPLFYSCEHTCIVDHSRESKASMTIQSHQIFDKRSYARPSLFEKDTSISERVT